MLTLEVTGNLCPRMWNVPFVVFFNVFFFVLFFFFRKDELSAHMRSRLTLEISFVICVMGMWNVPLV